MAKITIDEFMAFKGKLVDKIADVSKHYLEDDAVLSDRRRHDMLFDVSRELLHLMDAYNVSLDDIAVHYSPTDGQVSVDFIDGNTKKLTLEHQKEISEISDTVQTKLLEYIPEHYSIYDIEEYKEYMYSIIREKACDIGIDILEEEYVVKKEDFDDIVELICESIDYDEFDDLFRDMKRRTIEDKLSDLGMSYKDFI